MSMVDLDKFSGSIYAAELKRQPALRFSEPLEREFLADHCERARGRARIWTAVALGLIVAFGIRRWVADGGLSAGSATHFLVLAPLTLVVTWFAYKPDGMAVYMKLVRVIAPVVTAGAAVLNARIVSLGMGEELAILTLVLIASFFFTGLLFRAAVVTAVSIVVAFTLAAAAFGMTVGLLVKCAIFLGIATGAGAAVSLEIEHGYRRRFLEEKLIDELADRDGLTGLKNRGAFDEHLARVWQQALRERDELSLLLVDVDYFKRYNDRYGHQAGDAALQRIAHLVEKFFRRPLDIAARFGGEELVLLLYGVSADAAAAIGEQLRAGVEALGMDHADSDCADHATISVGVATVTPSSSRSSAGLVQLADEALYAAKDAGRNRCVAESGQKYAKLVTGRFRTRPRLTH